MPTRKRSTHRQAVYYTHIYTCKGGAVLMKGCNMFQEAISGLIGANVITQKTEHTSFGISFPATHNH